MQRTNFLNQAFERGRVKQLNKLLARQAEEPAQFVSNEPARDRVLHRMQSIGPVRANGERWLGSIQIPLAPLQLDKFDPILVHFLI